MSKIEEKILQDQVNSESILEGHEGKVNIDSSSISYTVVVKTYNIPKSSKGDQYSDGELRLTGRINIDKEDIDFFESSTILELVKEVDNHFIFSLRWVDYINLW